MSCATAIQAAVYDGRDNEITLVVSDVAGVVADLSSVSRITLDLDGGTTVIDSAVAGSSVIWWTDTATYRGATVDVVKLALGGQGIAAGEYAACELVIYDTDHTNGRQLETPIKIEVVA